MKDEQDTRTKDAFGGSEAPRSPFVDTPNRRESVAKEKAVLALTLGGLINRVPPGVLNGPRGGVLAWKAARAAAEKVAKKQNASVHELIAAIGSMQAFK